MKNLIKLVINLTVLCLIFLNVSILYSQENNNRFTVVLDPGHGGKDPGNRGNGYYEKNIALSIALKVGYELEKQSDIKVIYTRKKDVFVNLFVCNLFVFCFLTTNVLLFFFFPLKKTTIVCV